MKQVTAYEANDGRLFLTQDDCEEYEHNLSLRTNTKLSKAEQKVYDAILIFNKQEKVASHLGIQLVTVKKHCSNIYKKYGVTSKEELIKQIYKGN
jgi:DNA-binding NarL/FixJ family response regulator